MDFFSNSITFPSTYPNSCSRTTPAMPQVSIELTEKENTDIEAAATFDRRSKRGFILHHAMVAAEAILQDRQSDQPEPQPATEHDH